MDCSSRHHAAVAGVKRVVVVYAAIVAVAPVLAVDVVAAFKAQVVVVVAIL